MLDIDAAKKLLDTSAEKNRNLLIAFMAYLATAPILALSITDFDLLVDQKTIQLPLLSIGLPMWAFYTVIPLIMLLLHFDVLQNVQEHNKKLDAWLALLSDEEKVKAGQQLFPYILDFARVRYGLEATPSLENRLVAVGAWLMYVYLPLLVFTLFFIRFADLQGVLTSLFHLALGLLDFHLMRIFWRKMRSSKLEPQRLARLLNFCAYTLQRLAVLWVFALWFFIQVAHFGPDWFSEEKTLDKPAVHALAPAWLTDTIMSAINLEIALAKIGAIAIVPRIVAPNAQLFEVKEDDIRLQKWLEPNKTEEDLWAARPRPLDWGNRRLAFADLSASTLQRVNFQGADLQYANLSSAQLQGANLNYANMQGANFSGANMQGAYSIFANMQGANLNYVNMQGADFFGTSINSAHLSYAQLQGTKLKHARLQDANLNYANMQGANLESAKMQRTNLSSAQLQGAILKRTELQGANLSSAQLQGADLQKAKIFGVDWRFSKTDGMYSHDLDRTTRSHFAAYLPSAGNLPDPPPHVPNPLGTQDKGLHTKTWLSMLCQKQASHIGMVSGPHGIYTLPMPKQDIRDYVSKEPRCELYRLKTLELLKK